MAQAKSAATRKGGGARAAKAERNGKRQIDFQGLKLTIPPKLPASFAYRFAKITGLEERGENATGETYNLLVKVIGEEQFEAVMEHVDSNGAEDSGPIDLIVALIQEYGSTPGKSEASASS